MELNTEMENRSIQQQQIIHPLDKQQTIVNQTQQIAYSSLLLIQQLEKRLELLQTKIDYVLDYIQQGELIDVQQMEYFAELDSYIRFFRLRICMVPTTTRGVGNWFGHLSQWTVVTTNHFPNGTTDYFVRRQ